MQKKRDDKLFGFDHCKSLMGSAYQDTTTKKFGLFWLNDIEVGYGYVVGNY